MRVVITLVTVGVAIYALVDCLRSRPGEIRGLPKVLWLVSYVVLRGLRDQVALQVADRVARRTGQRPGPGVDEQTEDAELDELDARKPAPRDSAATD